MAITKEELFAVIKQREKKLSKDLQKKVYMVDNPKKRHPAYKQISGRLHELKWLKNQINKLKEGKADE